MRDEEEEEEDAWEERGVLKRALAPLEMKSHAVVSCLPECWELNFSLLQGHQKLQPLSHL